MGPMKTEKAITWDANEWNAKFLEPSALWDPTRPVDGIPKNLNASIFSPGAFGRSVKPDEIYLTRGVPSLHIARQAIGHVVDVNNPKLPTTLPSKWFVLHQLEAIKDASVKMYPESFNHIKKELVDAVDRVGQRFPGVVGNVPDIAPTPLMKCLYSHLREKSGLSMGMKQCTTEEANQRFTDLLGEHGLLPLGETQPHEALLDKLDTIVGEPGATWAHKALADTYNFLCITQDHSDGWLRCLRLSGTEAFAPVFKTLEQRGIQHRGWHNFHDMDSVKLDIRSLLERVEYSVRVSVGLSLTDNFNERFDRWWRCNVASVRAFIDFMKSSRDSNVPEHKKAIVERVDAEAFERDVDISTVEDVALIVKATAESAPRLPSGYSTQAITVKPTVESAQPTRPPSTPSSAQQCLPPSLSTARDKAGAHQATLNSLSRPGPARRGKRRLCTYFARTLEPTQSTSEPNATIPVESAENATGKRTSAKNATGKRTSVRPESGEGIFEWKPKLLFQSGGNRGTNAIRGVARGVSRVLKKRSSRRVGAGTFAEKQVAGSAVPVAVRKKGEKDPAAVRAPLARDSVICGTDWGCPVFD